jgi:hypothetical protein
LNFELVTNNLVGARKSLSCGVEIATFGLPALTRGCTRVHGHRASLLLATILQAQGAMFEDFTADTKAGPTWRTRIQTWRTRIQTYAWGVSGIGFFVFSVGLIFATGSEIAGLTGLPPTPPEVKRDVVTEAADRLGRRASFRILLFTDEFRWKLSSFDALEAQPAKPHFTTEMKAVLDRAEAIICVGASSEEIPEGVPFEVGRRREEQRAARRAERIAVWVREAVSRPIPIRKLNVGHHAATGLRADTSDQRRVVIILVLDHDQDANLDQALRAAMANESLNAPIFEALLTRYSLSSQSFSWVP